MRAIKGGKCNNLEAIQEETCSITSLSHTPQSPEELSEITEYVTFCVYHVCVKSTTCYQQGQVVQGVAYILLTYEDSGMHTPQVYMLVVVVESSMYTT